MPRYHTNQSLSRGLTLIELVIGIAVTGTVALVLASLIKGGTNVYVFTTRQAAALQSAREALVGNGNKNGLIPAALQAYSVADSSSTTSLEVSPLSGQSTTYLISKNGLYQSVLSNETLLASNVIGLTVTYYGISTSGLIYSTTIPASVSLVTVLVQTQATATGAKIDSFFSGGRLRTGP
jgi:type II secretory pathway pseudopilin PulG